MALDERYILASDLANYVVDKDSGLPLAAGTYTFFSDIARNVPKPVFQLTGAPGNYSYTSMGAQITLSAVGTVQNSGGDNVLIYYYPYDSEGNIEQYYVTCRSSGGIEQFTRQAWPHITSANDPTKDQTAVQNQISNPTFTNVFINEGKVTTFTVSGANSQVFEFAPNWDFVITGSGSVTVERIPVTGNENVPTSPPYVLEIQVSIGITFCYFRQRFSYNSGLWASTSNNPLFLAGSFVVRNEAGGTTGLQMFYQESSGGSPIIIVDAAFQSNYVLVSGSTENAIPLSTNTDSGKDGYVDIYLALIPGSHIRLSSIQVIPTASNSVNLVLYDTNSSNREEALQGDYYIPRLVQKRINSFLVGWDFPLNPFQLGASGNLATTGAYIADQTIGVRGATGNVTWSIDPVTHSLRFTTAGADDAFCFMQYLSGNQVKEIVTSRLAVNVFAYQGTAGDPVTMRVYLFRAPAAASFPIIPTLIGNLSIDGTFSVSAANWTEIPRSGLDTAQATLKKATSNTDINNGQNDYGFSGWEIVDNTQIGDTDKFAIVVTFHYADATTQINVNSISCVPGDLPCRPAVKSFQETVSECEYYYEKSYDTSIGPGTVTSDGAVVGEQVIDITATTSYASYPRFVPVRYKTRKRIAVVPTLFSAGDGAINNVYVLIYNGNAVVVQQNALASNFALNFDEGDSSFVLAPLNRAVSLNTPVAGSPTYATTEAIILFHYVADARLGIV